jgi:hypothetical protein
MSSKVVVTIFLLVFFALSSIAMIPMSPVKALGGTLTLSDAELILPEFAWEFDTGSSLTGKTDVPGPGVRFDLAGLGKAGVGDNFPVNALAGGTGTHNGDFTAYSKYSMLFVNLGSDPVSVALFMNTGWTDPPQDGTYDTFWSSNWIYLAVGRSAIVTLNFSSCGEVWNAGNDPVPEWRHPNGSGGWLVRRLDQVSNIGFMVMGGSSASVLVSGTLTQLYIDPPVVNKTPGDVCTTFDVTATLENFANLAGFDIKLTWNGTMITCTGVDYITYLNALWGAGKWSVPIEESSVGSYRIVAVALATSASNLGASVLFKMTFHVDTSGNFPLSTPIHFDVAKLSDNAQPVPNPIYAEVTDGMYYMSAPSLQASSSIAKSLGKIFTTNITVHDVVNLYDFEFWLYYNTSLLDIWNPYVQLGPLLSGANIYINEWNDLSGYVHFAAKLTSPAPPVNGTGTIAIVTFKVTAASIWPDPDLQCTLDLNNTKLKTHGGTEILHYEVDGSYSYTPLIGDLTSDGTVDLDDIYIISLAYGSKLGDPNWESCKIADLNRDNVVNVLDLRTAARHYGEDC